MSENNKVKVNIPVQPRAYEKLYIIPESAFVDPEFPTYNEAQTWMQNFTNIPIIERYHATVIYNTPSYTTEFGNIVVNPEYAWRVLTDGSGGTDIVTYKTGTASEIKLRTLILSVDVNVEDIDSLGVDDGLDFTILSNDYPTLSEVFVTANVDITYNLTCIRVYMPYDIINFNAICAEQNGSIEYKGYIEATTILTVQYLKVTETTNDLEPITNANGLIYITINYLA
jgi:hypothetical protein